MNTAAVLPATSTLKQLNVFERYLTIWVGLCMVTGIALGHWVLLHVEACRRIASRSGPV